MSKMPKKKLFHKSNWNHKKFAWSKVFLFWEWFELQSKKITQNCTNHSRVMFNQLVVIHSFWIVEIDVDESEWVAFEFAHCDIFYFNQKLKILFCQENHFYWNHCLVDLSLGLANWTVWRSISKWFMMNRHSQLMLTWNALLAKGAVLTAFVWSGQFQ